MNKLFSLTRIQLKDFFSKYSQQLNINNKTLRKFVILLPLLILLPVVQVIRQLYHGFLMIGYPELIITYAYTGATMFSFFLAIPFVVSVFFYSKDLSLIATLPVRVETVVFSKLASVYVYLFATGVILFGSSVGFYAFGEGLHLIRLFMGFAALIAMPILPMIFAVLMVLPFMSFIGGRKNRNFMIIFGNVILLTAVIGMQVLVTRVQLDPESLQQLIESEDGLISHAGRQFPPSIWLTGMVRGSFTDTVKYLVLNAGFILILRAFANRLYQNALLKYNQQSTAGRRGAVKYTQHSKKWLLVRRHIGIITGNPTFLLNTVLVLFLPILMFAIYAVTGIMNLETFSDPMIEPVALYIFTGIILSPSIVGSLSATAITREGKTFWETRVLPITIKDNISARIQSTVLINGVATALLALTVFRILPLSLTDILLGLIAAASGIICFATIDLIINIERPYLNWSNPTAAIKNNLNIIISLVVRVAVGVIGYGLYLFFPVFSSQTLLIGFTIVFLIIYMIGRKLIYGPYAQKFERMDI
jgi:ABC-2 type transport system permease protein